MNKFLKGAIAGALVAPCVLGLAGCTKPKNNEDKSSEIYSSIYEEVSSFTAPFQAVSTPGNEAQLTVNVKIDYKSIVAGIAGAENSLTANLRAVVGARHSEGREVFGSLGLVDAQNNFTSLLSAYAVDDIDTDATVDTDEEYTLIGQIPAGDWELFSGLVYVVSEGAYVPAGETHDPEVDYYMMTKDLLHIYLESNMSALDDYLGFSISEMLPVPSGKIYATLDMGDEIPEAVIPDEGADAGLFDLEEMLNTINELESYDKFKASAEESGLKISSNYNAGGDSSLTLTDEDVTCKFIVKADGSLSIVINSQKDNGTSKEDVTITIDFESDDEIDETYIPSDLAEYGDEPQDFEEVVYGLIAPFMPVE